MFKQATLVLGVGLLLLGIILAVSGGGTVINVSTADRLFDGIVGGIVLAGAILVGAGIGLVKTRAVKNTDTPEPLVTDARDGADDEGQIFLGRQFEEEYRAVLATGDFSASKRVRERLRDAAVETVFTAGEQSRQEARNLVLSGDWTDDPIVAAFLGDETADAPPLKWQVYSWLYDDRAFERSVERSLTEIEQYGQGPMQ